MELKLADEEKKESSGGGLKLAGEGETKDVSGNKTENSNPWDFDEEREPIRITSISGTSGNHSAYADSAKAKSNGSNVVLLIGKIVVSLMLVLEFALIVWCCIQDKSEIVINLTKFQGFFGACVVVCIIDAILVNIFYGRKLSLIFIAWFFYFLYPAQRNKHINGSAGEGTLFCIGLLIAYAALVGTSFSAVSTYGNSVFITDDVTRKAVAELIDQPEQSGGTLGQKLNQNIYIENAEVQVNNSETRVVIAGLGRHYIDGTGNLIEMEGKSIPTQLLFVKKNANDTYKLSGAVLDSATLNSEYLNFYNTSVIYR